MNLLKLCTLALCLLPILPSAYALDQVILKSGEVIDGKIQSDNPLHVDIQFLNGTKVRYQRDQIQSTEYDTPSNSSDEQKSYGTQAKVWLAGELGGLFPLNNTAGVGMTLRFNYGGRLGLNIAQVNNFAKFAMAFDFTHSDYTDVNTPGYATTMNEMMLEFLFTKVGGSGFYFGPEIGFAHRSTPTLQTTVDGTTGTVVTTTVITSNNPFDFGLNFGYELFLDDFFSLGPSLHLTHISGTADDTGQTLAKFLLVGTIHF